MVDDRDLAALRLALIRAVHSAGKRRAFREERQLIEQLRAVTNRILAQGRAAE